MNRSTLVMSVTAILMLIALIVHTIVHPTPSDTPTKEQVQHIVDSVRMEVTVEQAQAAKAELERLYPD
jgi:hypothetical protein